MNVPCAFWLIVYRIGRQRKCCLQGICANANAIKFNIKLISLYNKIRIRIALSRSDALDYLKTPSMS